MTSKFIAYILDNNTPQGEQLKKQLEAMNISVERFTDIKLFAQKLKTAKPSLCILDKDIRSPGDGIPLVQSIRKIFGEDFPMLVLLNPADKVASETVLKLHVQPLYKPVDMAKLKTAIAASLKAVAPPKTVPPLLENLFAKLVPIVVHLAQFLDAFDDLEKRVKFYCDIIEPYNDHFLALFNAAKKGDEQMKIDAGVRVYGINHVRDLVLALKLTEHLDPEKGFQWDPKTFKPRVPAENTVKYARKTLMHFGEDSRYKNVAYASGLVFDILAAVNSKNATEQAVEVRNLIDTLYEQSLTITDQAYSIMKDGTVVTSEIYVVMTCLMRNAGKIALAILEPGYLEIMKLYKAKNIPPLFQQVFEESKYKVHHNMLGSVFSQCLPSQSKAFFATLCFDTPLFLQGRENKLHFDLASICQRGYLKAFPPKQPR